jgi:hypothetical protein
LALDVADFAQALPEREHMVCERDSRCAAEEPDHRHRRLLRARRERPRGGGANERDELALNRRFGGLLSTGFTRVTSICGKVPVGRIIADSWACAASDDAAANTPNRLMNSRLFIRSPRRRGRAASAAP